MVKTARYYLIPDNRDINKILWGLQDNTRALKNKAVQILWEWCNFSQDFKKEQGDFPKPKEVLNYSFVTGYLYDKLKAESKLSTTNLSSTLQQVERAFKASEKDFLKGERSIITFKKNQPLDLHNRVIKLSHDNNVFYADIALMNKAAAKELNNGSCSVHFKMQVRDKSSRAIIERCHDGVYSVSGSKLCYDQKKKMWYINLCYGFENTNTVELDKDRVLGVNLSMTHPVTASVFGEYGRLIIDGGELDHIRKTTEARRISLLLQSKMCGEVDSHFVGQFTDLPRPVDRFACIEFLQMAVGQLQQDRKHCCRSRTCGIEVAVFDGRVDTGIGSLLRSLQNSKQTSEDIGGIAAFCIQ